MGSICLRGWEAFWRKIWGKCEYVCSVTRSCLTLWDLMDCSPQGSSVHGIFQARILSGLPFLPSRDLPTSGIEPSSPVYPALAEGFFTTEPPGKPFFSSSTFYFILEYNRLTLLWLFQVDSKGPQPYTCVYPFCPKLPSLPGCYITLNSVPCAKQEVLVGFPP